MDTNVAIPSPPAELIVHGGTILTVEGAQPRVEALAVAGGKILALGDTSSVMPVAGPHTQIVDLGGRCLLPGFIDAHGHFANALQVVAWANIQRPPAGPVTDIGSLQRVLTAHGARQGLKPGQWLVAYGYDPDGLADGRPLDKSDLDPLFPDNPVLLIHNSNHGAMLNSRALALLGYDASTPDPAGGVIVRRPGSREPAGLVMETAFLPLFVHMPKLSPEELLAGWSGCAIRPVAPTEPSLTGTSPPGMSFSGGWTDTPDLACWPGQTRTGLRGIAGTGQGEVAWGGSCRERSALHRAPARALSPAGKGAHGQRRGQHRRPSLPGSGPCLCLLP